MLPARVRLAVSFYKINSREVRDRAGDTLAIVPIALTIAGSDPSGGAGLQADLKTFHQFGVYGEAVATLVTVQNTLGVSRVDLLAPDLIAAQIRVVVSDIPPGAAKTGALGGPEAVEAVAEMAAAWGFPLVVDPVMISKHGAPLLESDAVEALRTKLIPRAMLLTPNLAEAAALADIEVTTLAHAREASRRIFDFGPGGVLVKGGHLIGEATDVFFDGHEFVEFPAEHFDSLHTHGTGCTYSAAITAGLALGWNLLDSISVAKRYIDAAIRTNPGLGGGQGPVNHFAPVIPPTRR
jgi:hydroxymethylpyrimidine/phosphomethylpyrimidine kinase